MKLKTTLLLISILLISTLSIHAQTPANKTIETILAAYSTRTFTTEPVTDGEIEQILKCGIKAPSGRNNQPWKFTVVKDLSKVKDLFRSIDEGNVVIVISGAESNPGVDFDCALATENMFIAAYSLGLGARIYTGPVHNISDEQVKLLEIPKGYKVVALLRIGKMDPKTDAVSSASPRNDMKDMVNYVK